MRGGEMFGAVITGSVRIRPDLAAFRTEPVIMAVGVVCGGRIVLIPDRGDDQPSIRATS